MAKSRTTTNQNSPSAHMVRLDEESKRLAFPCRGIRHISVSDYVRQITVAQARKEVDGASERTIVLTPDEQLAIWNALNTPVKLTPSQKILGKIMRGKS